MPNRKHLIALPALLLAVAPAAAEPVLEPITRVALLSGSPLHVELIAGPPESAVSFTAESSDPLLEATVLAGNRSLSVFVAGYGELVFELFEQRVSRATGRVAALAESGFYDGVTFHRIIDGFVIQGGDPTGGGAGGSGLGAFDDHYHPDLQHNRRGLLSMAKSVDDSNDSQFFVTEGATRSLDFQHSIFGLLTRGEAVREAISGVPTDASDRPITPVVMQSVRLIEDGGAATLMLKAPEGVAGTASVTVTATDEAGAVAVMTFDVDIAPDTIDSPPFLADIPAQTAKVDVPFSFALSAIDVEGEADTARFLDQATLASFGLGVPVVAHPDLVYAVDFVTGVVTVNPRNGLSGVHALTVATGVQTSAIDYQVVPITLEP